MRILYIDVDSLRPDHLGCYGYHRRTSPNIDAIAGSGTVLRQVYASDVPCLPSRTGFFGGWFGTKTGVINHGGRCAELTPEGSGRDFRSRSAENSLGARLSDAGYHACSISPFPRRHSGYQMMWGFREYFDTGRGGIDNAEEIFMPARDWLVRNGAKDNWFLHLNFWDPHTPYDTPVSFGNPFADEPIDPWITQDIIDRQRASYGPHSAREVPGIDSRLPKGWLWGRGTIETMDDAKAHVDGYDCGVAYVDRYIGQLCNVLAELGVLGEAAIVVSGDHGENLGELNVWGDHQTADEFTCHIPAVVAFPGIQPSEVYEGLAYHLDLAETILDAAGCPPRDSDGRSLLGVLESGETLRNELFLSQGAWSLQRSLRWENWICIKTVHTGMKEFPELMLFDLSQDAHQTANLASTHRKTAGAAAKKIDDWFESASSFSPMGDPFETVLTEGGPYHARKGSEDWFAYLDRLRQTGRAAQARWLAENGGRPVPARV